MKLIPSFNFMIFAVSFLVLGSTLAKADVKISGFSDMSFGTWSGIGDMSLTDDLCVFNSDGPNYIITATADNGSFTLTGTGNPIAYEVRFKKGSDAFTQLDYNSPFNVNGGAHTSQNNCGGGTNATLQITVTAAALGVGTPGIYESTLNLLLEPGDI